MEIFGVIFYIIIFAVFISAKKAAQSGSNQKTNRHGFDISEMGGRIKSDTQEMKKSVITNSVSKGKTPIPNVPTKGKTITPNVPRKKKRPSPFVEPHAEEKYQPRIRTNNLWGEDEHAGKRIVALRLMEGDPVPEGYVRIKCPYCGADNLVTKHCKQYHSCYFCRVPID